MVPYIEGFQEARIYDKLLKQSEALRHPHRAKHPKVAAMCSVMTRPRIPISEPLSKEDDFTTAGLEGFKSNTFAISRKTCVRLYASRRLHHQPLSARWSRHIPASTP